MSIGFPEDSGIFANQVKRDDAHAAITQTEVLPGCTNGQGKMLLVHQNPETRHRSACAALDLNRKYLVTKLDNIVHLRIRVSGFTMPIEELGVVKRRRILDKLKCRELLGEFAPC